VYLGANQTITIGDLTAKYTQSGYSSITWIEMPESGDYGKLARISDFTIEDRHDDDEV
jgi:hypothetical protein